MDAIIRSENFVKKSTYDFPELLNYAQRTMGKDFPPLPLLPMLAIHRITDISEYSGKYNRGYAMAECDVRLQEFFFSCHFKDAPLYPGVIMLDGLLQLTGFWFVWSGKRGQKGMALGSDKVRLKRPVTPATTVLELRIDVKITKASSALHTVIANGQVTDKGRVCCLAEGVRVGIVPSG